SWEDAMKVTALLTVAVLLLVVQASADAPDELSARVSESLVPNPLHGNAFLGHPDDTFELVIELNWSGRSTEVPDSCPYGPTRGGKVAEGLALSLDPNQVIFDNGDYTPSSNKNAVPVGNEWASWPHWHPSTYEVRHLRATFDLPELPDNVLDIILFSPYYTEFGHILPINDNLYLYLNGLSVGMKGTDYGAKNGGMGGTAPFANETDGWYQDGSFGPDGAIALKVGDNVLDFVAEERSGWGGIGRLDLKLLVASRDCEPVEPWLVRTQGYWRRQCKHDPHEDICSYVDSIHGLADLFDAFDCDSICDLMRVNPPERDMCRKARRQFMALLLNIASGKLAVCNCLEDGGEVGDVIVEIDSILSGNLDHATCVYAKTLADDLNNGIGIVPCDTLWGVAPPKSILPPPSCFVTPNPFVESTLIQYELKTQKHVGLHIHDKTGRLVRTLVNGEQAGGSYSIEWDGLDEAGRRVPTGIYFSRLHLGSSIASGKLILLR
ncbi:MAG: FlgD immunoglobulin-like domain containing protein, partial [bacterium]